MTRLASKVSRTQEPETAARSTTASRTPHALHHTVDVLEIVMRFAGRHGIVNLIELSAVNTGFAAAVGNLATEELVVRQCRDRKWRDGERWSDNGAGRDDDDDDNDDDEHQREADSQSHPGDPFCFFAETDTDTDTRSSGTDDYVALWFEYGSEARFPVHTVLLLLAARGNGSRADRLRQFRDLCVVVHSYVSPVQSNAMGVLAHVVGRGWSFRGVKLFVRCEPTSAVALHDKIAWVLVDDEPVRDLPSEEQSLATALAASEAAMRIVMNTDKAALKCLTFHLPKAYGPVRVGETLAVFPNLRFVDVRASFDPKAPLLPPDACPRLQYFGMTDWANSRSGEEVRAFLLSLPRDRPGLKGIYVGMPSWDALLAFVEGFTAGICALVAERDAENDCSKSIALERVCAHAPEGDIYNGWNPHDASAPRPWTPGQQKLRECAAKLVNTLPAIRDQVFYTQCCLLGLWSGHRFLVQAGIRRALGWDVSVDLSD